LREKATTALAGGRVSARNSSVRLSVPCREQSAADGLATVPTPAQVAAARARRAAQRRKGERQAAREAEWAADRLRGQRKREAAAASW
jgi:molybdopterin biosynthesis enzyme